MSDQAAVLENGDNNLNNKRKTKQISLSDYFTKRRKVSTASNEPKTGVDVENQGEKIRDILPPSAAERHISLLDESEAEKRLAGITKEIAMSHIAVETTTAAAASSVQPEQSPSNSGASASDTEDTATRGDIAIPEHFNRSADCCDVLPALKPSHDHTMLIKPHILRNKAPLPYPNKYRDRWDKEHVRMPCSPENLYPARDKKVQNRWELIEATLLQTFSSSNDLEEAILVYNHHYKVKWDFESWHSYCNIELDAVQREELFTNLLPGMVNLALQLPNVVTQPPRLLTRGKDHIQTMSQKQIACLLANAFFCTFPRRNSLKSSEYCNYPDINFSRMFRGIKDVVNGVKTEKLKCILNYFSRVLSEMPTGTVSYHRKVLTDECIPVWEEKGSVEFHDLFVSSEGTIEEHGAGFLQVDFANRMIGGGVVGEGCVQEEIRFLMCPEMIVSRLFTEKLESNESLLITGAERYNSYTGYAQTFKHAGNYNDFTGRDRWGRRFCEMIAIDAHVFHCYKDQFKRASMKRELEKAYCGFRQAGGDDQKTAVATGNWGCGAFGGDVYLKSILQLMAASTAGRDVVYFTFKDESLSRELKEMHEYMIKNKVSVGRMWTYLVKYGHELKSKNEHIPLYPYLKQLHETYEAVTDDDASSCNEDNPLVERGIPCEIPPDMSPLSPEYIADTP